MMSVVLSFTLISSPVEGLWFRIMLLEMEIKGYHVWKLAKIVYFWLRSASTLARIPLECVYTFKLTQ